jgi:hypothetical protein
MRRAAPVGTDALAGAGRRGRRVFVDHAQPRARRRAKSATFTVIRFLSREAGARASHIPGRYHANPIFYLYAGFTLARVARREKADVIHVQNKHMLVPGVLARALTGLPVVATIRDGSIIDAAPMCLHHGDRMTADCGVRKLWRECSVEYFDLYARGRRARLMTKLAFLYRWLDARVKQRFLRRVDAVVTVSQGILDIYRRSALLDGVPRLRVVPTVPSLAGTERGRGRCATTRDLAASACALRRQAVAGQGDRRFPGSRAPCRARRGRRALRRRRRRRRGDGGAVRPTPGPAPQSRGPRPLSAGRGGRRAVGHPGRVEPGHSRGDGRRPAGDRNACRR